MACSLGPAIGRLVFQFLKRAKQRREILAHRLGFGTDTIAGQPGYSAVTGIHHDDLAFACLARLARATDLPGVLAILRQSRPQIERQALSGEIDQIGQLRRIGFIGQTQWSLQRNHDGLNSGFKRRT